ncbi:MAG: ATP-dependent DNA ligase [Bacteroidota bacterium]
MKHFARLFKNLDQTTKTNTKVAALVQYFEAAEEQDMLWTIAILSHRRPRRSVKTTLLRAWAAELSGIPLWLLEDSYYVVGDLAEAISLLLPPTSGQSDQSFTYWIDYVRSLAKLEEEEKKEKVVAAWQVLDTTERFIFNKLITGGFRVGVSQKLMTKALAQYLKVEDSILAHRLMGDWTPDSTSFEELLLKENPQDDISKPYPFYLAYALEEEPENLGAVTDWQIERKWDGIRGQIILRAGELFVWSRGEELMTNRFPEYHQLPKQLPHGTVIDGEILPFRDGKPLSFNVLQTRIGRKKVSKKVLENAPVVLIAYDLLEWQGTDIRARPMSERRELLEQMLAEYDTEGIVLLSELVEADSWEAYKNERANSRAHQSEGLMLKRKNSIYKAGRKKGDWWKWKVDPLTIDAVMIYAQRGSGRRANLYTDYTFGVWRDELLVPFTKAYSGLTDKEFRQITAWVRQNTLERFGPVRSVKPTHVFEIAFEGIQKSTRHKSGVALRFPRMLRWRKDKKIQDANTLEDLHQMLEVYGG